MDKQDQTKQQEPNREQERTSNTGNEQQRQQKPGISHIKDRQEGEMDNGELGGNMGQKKEERNKE